MSLVGVPKARAAVKAKEGSKETPPGSNIHWVWTWIKALFGVNYQRSPYCGAGVIWTARQGGVKLPLLFISVAAAEDWAKARGRWHYGPAGMKAGDAPVLIRRGHHIEWAGSAFVDGRYDSAGFNTSERNLWNGGEVRYQSRPGSIVYGYVRLHDLYPDDWKPVPWRLAPTAFLGRKKVVKNRALRIRVKNGRENARTKRATEVLQRSLVTLGYDVPVTGHANPEQHAAMQTWKRRQGRTGKAVNGRCGRWDFRTIQRQAHARG